MIKRLCVFCGSSAGDAHRPKLMGRCAFNSDAPPPSMPSGGTALRSTAIRSDFAPVQADRTGDSIAALTGTVVTTETSNTLADGMATRVPVPEALAIIRKGAARIVQVRDDEVAAAVGAAFFGATPEGDSLGLETPLLFENLDPA